MNQEKSSVTVKNSIPSPTDLTQAAVARTQKASAKTSAMTQTLIEKSKALRTPSPAADKIGTTIGGIARCRSSCRRSNSIDSRLFLNRYRYSNLRRRRLVVQPLPLS